MAKRPTTKLVNKSSKRKPREDTNQTPYPVMQQIIERGKGRVPI